MSLPPPVPDKKITPHLSHAPWAGFLGREHARAQALPTCPAARCQRVKACISAHEGVFCQRTHFSHAAFVASQPAPAPLAVEGDLEYWGEHMVELLEVRKAAHLALVARWKAGEFDALYGKWRACGVVLAPPARVFR